ncbi:formyltetrahydrofolate-dependent phosphoribosylglycinamide formyltransferase [Psychromonas ingrahamii 37]|uniref:Phosphoribosylglycinamide formyltransferase n=1 Tax=Psychromonas ingrahamii (strain DSM 17664 / CCUG 51855 / 37) TaxID=357804 RepID=A1STU2_PSYIN|nr:phosphoribosylglycinamide formyltransferase [Psychromonas ingrahamii]ABM02907.1 formyltetrahydrofolate-dependent phosphoribosylglycinamide formyltransferase [Psychromonas ingrahamii 37]
MATVATKKIVVLLSGNGSNLQNIIDKLHNTTLNNQHIEIVAVLSNKADAYGLQRAQNAGIKHKAIISKGISSREQYDALLSQEIDQYQPDLIVMAGFMRILSAQFIDKYPGKMLNIHPSLLPKYQGTNTHQRAIDAGDSEHGVSVHFVTEELDSGATVIQAKVPIFSEDSAEKLAERVLTQEHLIYPLAIQWFLSGRLSMVNSHALLDGLILPANGYAAD